MDETNTEKNGMHIAHPMAMITCIYGYREFIVINYNITHAQVSEVQESPEESSVGLYHA